MIKGCVQNEFEVAVIMIMVMNLGSLKTISRMTVCQYQQTLS